MCRHLVSNPATLSRFVVERLKVPRNGSHRALIVIEMAPQNWLKSFASTLSIPFIDAQDPVDRSDKITALLGTENRVLAHALPEVIDAGLLAALAGTIGIQGILILSLPYALDLSSEKQQDISQVSVPRSLFTKRLIALLRRQLTAYPKDAFLFRLQHSEKLRIDDSTAELIGQPVSGDMSAPRLHPDIKGLRENSRARTEQNELTTSAVQHLRNSATACVTIVGKRGRGKSSLLARVANRFQSAGFSCAVFAPSSSALRSFHRLTDHNSERYSLTTTQLGSATPDILFVDEAGNLSIDILMSLLSKNIRLVLSTTVEGYENAGRAFENRFMQAAEYKKCSVLNLQPQHPWRWITGDPIEELVDNLILNSKTLPEDGTTENHTHREHDNIAHNLRIKRITQSSLAGDEKLLSSIYKLLRDTHYQSTVKDLQHLLDGKSIQIWTAWDTEQTKLIALALVTVESDIEPSLHKDIVNKKRRLPHQLLLQLLAQSANTAAALNFRVARVVRISVVDHYRRLGVATALLKNIEQELMFACSESNKVNAVGASFANDPISLNFWLSNGYGIFHEGFKKNPRTGTHALAVLKTDNDLVAKVLNMASHILADNQQWRNDRTKTNPSTDASVNDDELLMQFANGHRSFYDTYAALSRLALRTGAFSLNFTQDSRRTQERNLRTTVCKLLEN